MKVFISWSGDRSKALAIALKEWLPLILQYVQPWVSEKDISAGERWAQAISGELDSSNFGVLCITPENIKSEWILFEAGALSKSMIDSKVIPLLFGLELSDLSGPLSQFQALKVDQQGVMDVVKAINAVSEVKASEVAINQLVPALWPQLQQKIDSIPGKAPIGKHMRPQGEILEELVTQVRGLGSRMHDLDAEFVDNDRVFLGRSKSEIDYRIIDDLMDESIKLGNPDMSLLMIAGLIRDLTPWLSEVLIEAHRDLKTASPKDARKIAMQLMQIVDQTCRGRMGERVMGRTKFGFMLIKRLPMLVDRALTSRVNFRFKTDAIDDNLSEDI